jgi:hypothetical protein
MQVLHRSGSAQHVHVPARLVQVEVSRHGARHIGWGATACEPASASVALRARSALAALDALRARVTLQTLGSLRPFDALRPLDRAAIHPAVSARVPHLERVIGLNDVGIALGGVCRQVGSCWHVSLEGDAQTRCTLDALLPLCPLRTCRALCTSRARRTLRAYAAIGTGQALHPLGALRAGVALGALE